MARSPFRQAPVASINGMFARLVEAGGMAAALKLIAACGGHEIKLSARPGSKLARIVGDEAARAIVDAMGPEKITVPMAHVKGQAGRREMAARLLSGGRSVSEAASLADVHERTVWRVRARLKDEETLPLFGQSDDEADEAADEAARATRFRRT